MKKRGPTTKKVIIISLVLFLLIFMFFIYRSQPEKQDKIIPTSYNIEKTGEKYNINITLQEDDINDIMEIKQENNTYALKKTKQDTSGGGATGMASIEIQGADRPDFKFKILDYKGDEITTQVLVVEEINIEKATITLAKKAGVGRIMYCKDFAINASACSNWEETNIPFIDNGDTITFEVTHFTGYGGAALNVNLTIWDDTNDPEGENTTHYSNEQIGFYANYTNTTGEPINGTDINCTIKFNLTGSWQDMDNMTFNSTNKLYQYNKSFTQNGTFYFNVLCNGSVQGYNASNATDDFIVTARNVLFTKNIYEFNVSRIDGAQVLIEIINKLTDSEIIYANYTSNRVGAFVGAEGNLNWGANLSANQRYNMTFQAYIFNATEQQINYTLYLWKGINFSNLTDTATLVLNLPATSEYNFTVTPENWNITMSDSSSVSTICSNTTNSFIINNTGNEPCADLQINITGNLDIKVIPLVHNYKLDANKTKNFTIYANVNQTTSDSSAIVNITGCFNSRLITINYTSPGGVWAVIPSKNNTQYIQTVSITQCLNGGKYQVDLDISEQTCEPTSAQLIINFVTSADTQAFGATISLNNNLVANLESLESVIIDIDPSILKPINTLRVELVDPPPNPHFEFAAQSSLVTNCGEGSATSIYSSQYCNTCTLETTGSNAVYNYTQLNIFETINSTSCTGDFYANYTYFDRITTTDTSTVISTEANCNDWLDNDCDFLIDCEDPDCCSYSGCQTKDICLPTVSENCTDSIDNDGDGLIDCNDYGDCCSDADCLTNSACNGVTFSCGSTVEACTSFILPNDLTCSGNGINLEVFQGCSTILDCKGRKIKGSGSGIGINATWTKYPASYSWDELSKPRIYVINCTVEDFDAGIYYQGIRDNLSYIKKSTLLNNTKGIVANASGIKIYDNIVESSKNNQIGIYAYDFGGFYGSDYFGDIYNNTINMSGDNSKGIFYKVGPHNFSTYNYLDYLYRIYLKDNIIDMDESLNSWALFFENFLDSTIDIVTNVIDGTNITIDKFNISGNYSGNLSIKGVTAPGADPGGKSNISKYIKINKTDILSRLSNITLSMFYEDINLLYANESTLKMYEDSGAWSLIPGSTVNTTLNKAYNATITTFGLDYAPFGDYIDRENFISNATCNITYTLAPTGPFFMTELTKIYWHNHTVITDSGQSGIYSYTVTCNKTGYQTLTETDSFTAPAACESAPAGVVPEFNLIGIILILIIAIAGYAVVSGKEIKTGKIKKKKAGKK